MDSLNLARNIAESNFFELSHPLKYEQSAPILFLYLSKCTTLLFGISEYSLRIIPVLSGIGCLYFFGKVLQKLHFKKLIAFGIFWMGSNAMFLRYATEYKQYMTDAFVSVFLIWIAIKYNKATVKNMLPLAIIFAGAIWLSMPSVFIIFSILIYFAWNQYVQKEKFSPLFFMSIWVILNFVLEYFLILQPAAESDHMQNFHQNYFIQGKFWNIDAIKHDFGLFVSTIRLSFGKSGLAIGVALVLIFISIYDYIKTKNATGILFIIPIVAVFGASMLGKYSLIERLMIFTMPLLFILILHGLNSVVDRLKSTPNWIKYISHVVLLLAFIASIGQTQGFKYLLNPLEIEDNRNALIHIHHHESSKNPIITTQLAYPAYAYYKEYDINHKYLAIGEAIKCEYGQDIIQLAIDINQNKKKDVWILMGHMLEHEITELISNLDNAGTIKNSYRTNRSAAILFSTQ